MDVSTRPINIPPEICAIICQDPAIQHCDLHNLCSLSQAFRAEAERLLYTAVQLRGTRRIKAFWCVIARRPHLALRLKKLVLFMPPQTDLEAQDLSCIMHALKLSVNLKELQTMKDYTAGFADKVGDAVQTWILEGHRFQLTRFANSYFWPQSLVKFLTNQPAIETLALKCKGSAEVCNAPLPMLNTLDTSAAVMQDFSARLWHKRSIQRLQFELVESTDALVLSTFVALTLFSKSLKSLSINLKRKDHMNYDCLDIGVLAACVAHQLPDIKYLRIMDHMPKFPILELPPFPIQFEKIETVILHPPTLYSPTQANEDADSDATVSAYIELRSSEYRTRAAARIMASLPTLTRLVIVVKHIHEFRRNLETGEISEQDLDTLDDEEWMQVS